MALFSKFVSRLSPSRIPTCRAMERVGHKSPVGPLLFNPLVELLGRPPEGDAQLPVTRGLDSRQAAITSDLCVRPAPYLHVQLPSCRSGDVPRLRGNR